MIVGAGNNHRCSRPTLLAIAIVSFAFLASVAHSHLAAEDSSTTALRGSASLAERWACLVSADVRRLRDHRVSILQELDGVPPLSAGHQGPRLGYHSPYLESPEEVISLTLDLGAPHAIDVVALVPAESLVAGKRIPGYGFPVRFRLELGMERPGEKTEWRILSDETASDFGNPGSFPVVYAAEGTAAQWVRLTTTRLWERGSGLHLLAMAEIIVLQGNRNLAVAAPVDVHRSLTSLPAWSAENLTDGQTPLGIPVSAVSSPTNGYMSLRETSPDVQKWVAVDLGKPYRIDEVRLVPAHPIDWPRFGYGFPPRFRIEIANTPDFTEPSLLADLSNQESPNPGDNVVTVPAGRAEARWVRCVATELFEQGTQRTGEPQYLFALAEMQVYSGDVNVAKEQFVTAHDVFHWEKRPRWDTAFLTDGFASQNQIIELPEWLVGLDRRRVLTAELAKTSHHLRSAVELVAGRSVTFVGGLGGILLRGAAISLLLSARRRRRQVAELARRIARDLHDDIGSGLGSIRLISEMAGQDEALPQTKADLNEIHRIARETGTAMQDLVWIIDARDRTEQEFFDQIQRLTHEMLAGMDVRFKFRGQATTRRLRLETRRNALLAFKEVLHNIRRHARAKTVNVEVAIDGRRFRFRVEDDGRGLSEGQNAGAGMGLKNLRERATAMRGHVTVECSDSGGTCVVFEGRL